jgi:hypothetical protein
MKNIEKCCLHLPKNMVECLCKETPQQTYAIHY